MPDTDPPIDTEAGVQYVLGQGKQADLAEILPVAALTKKREGKELAELGQLARAGAVAFSDEMRAIDSPSTLLKGMTYASMFGRAVIEFAQDPAMSSGAMNSGYEATLAGLPGIPSVAEDLAVARACMFAREAGCHYHAAKISTKNAVRAIKRARKLRVQVTAATCPHYFALTDALVRKHYDTAYKVFPPLRGAEDAAWLKRGLRAVWGRRPGDFAAGDADVAVAGRRNDARESRSRADVQPGQSAGRAQAQGRVDAGL
jgi:dihydroorotase